ncbi:MAG: glycosyltransferase family 4 protein [Planctomycetes bacterium]|nr:glycosyltransferase family 4 protein [Planctomycetota bacterium]
MPQHLNVATRHLLDPAGADFSTGGLQRWCRDLALLARVKGYEVTVYQMAAQEFEKRIAEGFTVRGLSCPASFRGNWRFCRELLRQVDSHDPIVFASQELALSDRFARAVGVNHGLWWDGDYPAWKRWYNKKLQYRFLTRMRGILCVDTNYINWCHAELPHRHRWQKKLTFIPNYADLDAFAPGPGHDASDGLLTLLFPRRVNYPQRGVALFLDAWSILEERGCKARALLVSPCVDPQPWREDLWNWAAAHGMSDRLEIREAALDDMASVYGQADVVVVPTLAHEGTSLAAVEGIVSGKPTVVTHIGGLGNIVIDGLNGHICDLTAESLADAILEAAQTRLLENREVLGRCRESLGKPRWERRVWSFLRQHLDL